MNKFVFPFFSTETLRKYPPGTRLRRRCLKNYKFSGTNVTIPKGVSVWIPVYSVHRDPKYYPKPELFDPERFESDAINARHPMAFLPFGEGPRNCIGKLLFNFLKIFKFNLKTKFFSNIKK